jgi:multicomponent Na+:H+ antiporter subunit D
MNLQMILDNLPALLIAIPLCGAFVTPLTNRAGDMIRNVWVLFITALSSLCGLLIASKVLKTGTFVYTFGIDALSHAIPPDSGGVPVRIIFTIDPINAYMLIIAAIVGFCITLYSLSSMERLSGKTDFTPSSCSSSQAYMG